NSRYPAIDLEIHMGIGTDIAALYGRGLLDVAIINREIDETDGADRNDNRPGEDIRVLYREGRVWAALRDMKLDSERPVPLALFPAPCAWRQLAQERLQSAGLRWTVALQSTRLSGIVTGGGGGTCDIDLCAERLKPAAAGARSRAGSPVAARLRIRRSPQCQAVVGGRSSARCHHRLFPAHRSTAPYQRQSKRPNLGTRTRQARFGSQANLLTDFSVSIRSRASGNEQSRVAHANRRSEAARHFWRADFYDSGW